MKKILLFQVDQPMNVKLALATMKLRVEVIPIDRFNQKVGNLVSGTYEEMTPYEGEKPDGSLLLMSGFTNSEVDQVLYRLRNKKVDIKFKAVLTSVNRDWDVPKLFTEMEREMKAIEAKYKLL
ncbi:MAG: DUF3783 domain-containing protein [Clostridiales bacterium]|nr:DUF3783 domain-containing protein [Clostridiales bacterium]